MTVRLILGDQLNYNHSWFKSVDASVIYFMAEMRQETDYVTHHIQKIVAFFKSMRNFAAHLQQLGHQVIYYELDQTENLQSITANLSQVLANKKADFFEYQLPDEYRLDQQLQKFCDTLSIASNVVDSEHFLTSRTDLTTFFKGKKQYTMEFFYRYMRKRFHIMMDNDDSPEGGKWNFDHSNRNKWKGDPEIPGKKNFNTDIQTIVSLLKTQNVKTIGVIDTTSFNCPTSRKESLAVLDYFFKHLLIHFGDFQDAMHTEEYYLFHSNLSFAMNSKQLHPKEVVDAVIHYWRSNKDTIAISQVEGFVRQIIGWREYMRGIYWMKMPDYANLNKLDNKNPLPDFYWTGKTKMNCLHHSITQSLQTGYAHHIQRLMVTGNYALLTQTNPDEVDKWYLGIYNDAIEWVEITNTRGMSQFADGGLVATKPYVSSGSYINKMSNYCKGCHYKVSKKIGENACPFNSLYWNFLDEKRPILKGNQRMRMMYSLLDKMDTETLVAHKQRAAHIISNPNDY
ncbi:cryptochrome/photolyase family protein [Aquimarina agarivorans]|uniref:cryptochrome/photolyase family protein n=1 Tax=Aquimarina agarivorans TaxID=980584 RepID=UPI000248FB01|nr:cryptochrome/photolyase family protein [Aquimarina agarivorans]